MQQSDINNANKSPSKSEKNNTSRKERLLQLLDLAANAVFTDINKAQHSLQEIEKNIISASPEEHATFFILSGYASNQLYDYENAEKYFSQAVALYEEYGDYKQQVEAYIDLTGALINLNKKIEATHYLDKCIKLLKPYPDERLSARLTCRQGFLHLHYANYAKATEFLHTADRSLNSLSKLSLKDYYFLTLIHSGLGNIYERIDDFEKSIASYIKVVSICEKMGIRSRLSWHYLHVGNTYMAIEDFQNAEYYFRKSINVHDDISQHARAGAFANLGYCSLRNKDFKNALQLFNSAEEIYTKIAPNNYSNFFHIERWKGHLYKEKGNTNSSMQHLGKALHYAQQNDDNKLLSIVFKDIAELYATLGNYQQAYEYQLLHDDASERHIEELNKRLLLELEIKYDAEKRSQETELLRLQASKLQLKALRAQMNPHFMFNVLNSIQYYITSNKTDSATEYLAKFARLTRSILDYSDEESITLEKELDFLNEYLEISQKLRFDGTMRYEITTDEDLEEDIISIPTMIVQPFVENAIEHGIRNQKNGYIKIHFKMLDDDTLLCIV
ncbi:MAG: histidine kinase, partial [Saprospiraceae bacterium]|nr:histidine kinase [Saprospiraceae bacterium]